MKSMNQIWIEIEKQEVRGWKLGNIANIIKSPPFIGSRKSEA